PAPRSRPGSAGPARDPPRGARGWSSPGPRPAVWSDNDSRPAVGSDRGVPSGVSPAAFAPFGQRGTLAAQRRVLAVARVEPGGVGKPVEDAFLDVGEQLLEPGRIAPGVADAAGEQAVPGEQV